MAIHDADRAGSSDEAVPLPRFRCEADIIFERAREFQRKTSDERWQTLFDLIDFGQSLLRRSPHREAARLLRQEQEDAWRQVQKELFRRHGNR